MRHAKRLCSSFDISFAVAYAHVVPGKLCTVCGWDARNHLRIVVSVCDCVSHQLREIVNISGIRIDRFAIRFFVVLFFILDNHVCR